MKWDYSRNYKTPINTQPIFEDYIKWTGKSGLDKDGYAIKFKVEKFQKLRRNYDSYDNTYEPWEITNYEDQKGETICRCRGMCEQYCPSCETSARATNLLECPDCNKKYCDECFDKDINTCKNCLDKYQCEICGTPTAK